MKAGFFKILGHENEIINQKDHFKQLLCIFATLNYFNHKTLHCLKRKISSQ